MIPRTLETKLKKLARQFPVVTITGPRQSGKTTLVKHAFPDYEYVSLEDIDSREFAETDPRGFLASIKKGAVIDEAQRVPSLFSYIQGIVDASGKAGRFILSGSQNFLLHEKISQTLAGRTAILKLLPLSLEEVRSANASRDDYRHFLFKGFFPRLYAQAVSPRDWYSAYVQTYVERDVRLLKNISDLSVFQRFIRLCAGRIGQVLNLNSLASDGGISHNTAKAWLSLLEASYIVVLLIPHHRNFSKRLIKMPKLYFLDPGLAAFLLGIKSVDQIDHHHMRGSLFETMVIADLMKHRLHRGFEPDGFFWRDKTGHEIDYLLDRGERLIPIEIKSGSTIQPEFFAGLSYWLKLSGQAADDGFLVYGGLRSERRQAGRVLSWRDAASVYDA